MMHAENRTETQTILAPNYETKIFPSNSALVRFERSHNWKAGESEINVFGECWSLAWPNLTPNHVSVRTRGKTIAIDGACALLIPPFSIIDWTFRGGTIFWQGLLSDQTYPSDFPKVPCMFRRMDNEYLPSNLEELKGFIQDRPIAAFLDKEEIPSVIATQMVNKINANWNNDLSIAELIESLGYSHACVDRAFKRAFGITPLTYRNKMRILDAAHRILLSQLKITEVAFAVGFSSLENFNKQFKKMMTVTPSSFLSV